MVITRLKIIRLPKEKFLSMAIKRIYIQIATNKYDIVSFESIADI